MSQEMMNTKELAQFLGIHEKQVYALIKAKRIPATRVTGRWVFPRRIIEEWIESRARQGFESDKPRTGRPEGAVLAAGSNDPVLDILQTYARQSDKGFQLFTANIGSTEGLKTLNKGHTDIAWSHLLDPETGEYNIPFLRTYLMDIKPVVVNLYYRQIGFLTAPDNPLAIGGFEDLTRKGVRFVNRQKGAGTRTLLDYHLLRHGIPAGEIRGYDRESYTHIEVGLSILTGEADVGLATSAVSRLLGLPFIPITWERFDMIMERSTFFLPSVQTFMDVLRSKAFRNRVSRIANYEFKDSGKILYSAQ